MKIEDLELENWFKKKLKKVVEHNEYDEDTLTEEECDKIDKWTPCDLIAREELNNGGGSAKGFLGITPNDCNKCYDYMKENKDYFVKNHLVSKKAWNNSHFPLWDNYDF